MSSKHVLPSQFIERFKTTIRQLHPVSEETFQLFLDEFKPINLKKGQVLVRQGEICKHLYFMIKGSLRCFEIDSNGRETNHHFYFENELASEFKSLQSEQPTNRNLVALSAGIALVAYRPKYQPLLQNNPEFIQSAFRFFQDSFFQEEERTNMLRKLSSEERYQFVLDNQAHLLQRISLTQLASWLGISRESLSRIRAKMAR